MPWRNNMLDRQFQSTLPAGGATSLRRTICKRRIYFNPRSPRGERRDDDKAMNDRWKISIHAPRGGSDTGQQIDAFIAQIFQSTLPAGGATGLSRRRCGPPKHFNPRSPRGERPITFRAWTASKNFNPRSPRGERQSRWKNLKATVIISIHAPRGGSDPRSSAAINPQNDFNPRSPRGERRPLRGHKALLDPFQSTLPAGGATPWRRKYFLASRRFQSTLPAGGATKIHGRHR